MKYGCARVSTDGQSVAVQVEQLTHAGAQQVYREKTAAHTRAGGQFRKVLDALDEGDVY
jgi:DNA invertase Pin-like site-specific DNA recombinase